jgi:hypothetical protein
MATVQERLRIMRNLGMAAVVKPNMATVQERLRIMRNLGMAAVVISTSKTKIRKSEIALG